MLLLFSPCTYRGLLKVQDGGQRVATARPRWNEPRGGRDGHRGVGGHLFVHTQLLQGGETLTQHRHSRTQHARLLNIRFWEGERARLYTVTIWCTCDAVTQTIKGQASVLPLWRTERVIQQVGSDTDGVSSCACSTFCSSEEIWPICSWWAEPSCCAKHGALKSFLPVEKKMTDSLCGAWMNGCTSSFLSSSSLLPFASLISTMSSDWIWRRDGGQQTARICLSKNLAEHGRLRVEFDL